MTQSQIKNLVANRLEEIKDMVLHPERYNRLGQRLYSRFQREVSALEPHERLAAALELIVAVREWEQSTLKRILADSEAIAAARARGTCR